MNENFVTNLKHRNLQDISSADAPRDPSWPGSANREKMNAADTDPGACGGRRPGWIDGGDGPGFSRHRRRRRRNPQGWGATERQMQPRLGTIDGGLSPAWYR